MSFVECSVTGYYKCTKCCKTVLVISGHNYCCEVCDNPMVFTRKYIHVLKQFPKKGSNL